MDKAREIDAKVGRIRPLKREMYDRRALTALPSATGGRPTTGPDQSQPLAAAVGVEGAPTPSPRPLVDEESFFRNGRLRYAQQPKTFLPTVGRLNRTIEEYTINNEDMVNITASYLEKLAAKDQKALLGFGTPYEAAQWAVAEIQRGLEPGNAPRVLDMIHQSRAGRQVYNYLRMIEEAQNAES